MKLKNLLIALLVLIPVAAAAYFQWDQITSLLRPETTFEAQEPSEPPAPKVLTEPVRITANDRVFEAVGTGRAQLSVNVYPAVSEEVTEVLFVPQQSVAKGDILYQLDDAEEQLAVRLAEVRLRDAERLLERYEKAGAEGAVPESEVDSARADFESAQVALEQAELAVAERKVRAPFDGVVGFSNVDPGDRVGPDTVLTSLDDRSVLHVNYEVPEILLGALQRQNEQRVEATTPAFPERTFDVMLSAQESRLDDQRRTLLIRGSIRNEEDLLRPGLSFRIRWRIPGEEYPTVPEISLQWGMDGSYVWAVRDGKAERVPGRVVARTAGRVLLDAEMTEQDEVVIEGLQRLRQGTEVEVLTRREEPG